jgi:hypothetical protein
MSGFETSQADLNLPAPLAMARSGENKNGNMMLVAVLGTTIVVLMGAWIGLLGWELFSLGRAVFDVL